MLELYFKDKLSISTY